jgi:hypothetical protein
MAEKPNPLPIKSIGLAVAIVIATVAVTTESSNNSLSKLVTWLTTFFTIIGALELALNLIRNELVTEWKILYKSIKKYFKKISSLKLKKEVVIDAASKDKEIVEKIESLLNFTGSALIKSVKELETNEDLQNANVIITLYCSDEVPPIWIEEHLRFYAITQVSPKFINRPLKILVCTTQEKQAEVEKYTNNIRNLNIEVVKIGETQDYENLLSIIREKLRE